MNFGQRHTLYILGAFVILVLLQIFGVIINARLESQLADRLLNASGIVINAIGVLVGLYNIYRGLQLRTAHPLWIVFLLLGMMCVFVNVVGLSG
jgi:hypothetical protein